MVFVFGQNDILRLIEKHFGLSSREEGENYHFLPKFANNIFAGKELRSTKWGIFDPSKGGQNWSDQNDLNGIWKSVNSYIDELQIHDKRNGPRENFTFLFWAVFLYRVKNKWGHEGPKISFPGGVLRCCNFLIFFL